MLKYEVVEEIPESLIQEYDKETAAGYIRKENIKNSKWKLVVKDGEEIAGFISGSIASDFEKAWIRSEKSENRQGVLEYLRYFRVTGIYVKPKYRKRKIGTILMKKANLEARRQGFDRLEIHDMTPQINALMRKEEARRHKLTTTSVIPMGLGWRGIVNFKRRK